MRGALRCPQITPPFCLSYPTYGWSDGPFHDIKLTEAPPTCIISLYAQRSNSSFETPHRPTVNLVLVDSCLCQRNAYQRDEIRFWLLKGYVRIWQIKIFNSRTNMINCLYLIHFYNRIGKSRKSSSKKSISNDYALATKLCIN